MKITIELDADELKEFAEMPERIRDLSLIVQGMDDRLYRIAETVNKLPAKFETKIRHYIGG